MYVCMYVYVGLFVNLVVGMDITGVWDFLVFNSSELLFSDLLANDTVLSSVWLSGHM